MELKPGEKLNGGYTVKIGGYSLMKISGYSPDWSNVYDDENSFTDYLGNEKKIFLGRKFSLKITTRRLTREEFNGLAAALRSETLMVECPDFEGECRCENIPAELKQANFNGTRYTVTFTLIAKNLTTDGDGL